MKLQTPSLNDFLAVVDPEETIDRAKAMAEMVQIIIFKTLAIVKNKLSKKNQDELNQILQENQDLDLEKFFEKIYDFFEKAGKEEQLIKTIDRQIEKVRVDYIKAHLTSMSLKKRKEVLVEFPFLETLISTHR